MKILFAEKHIKKILFTNIPSSSELYYLQEVLREMNYSAFLQESVMTPYFEVNNKRMDKGQKKHIKDIERRERKLKEESKIEYKHKSEMSDEEWLFIIKNKTERYKDSSIIHSRVQEFYRGLLHDLSQYILFDSLYVNDNLSAAHFGFLYNSKLYYYMPTFDQNNESGLGLMLMNDMVNNLNYEVFDSLIGIEEYKFYWCNESGMNYHLLGYKKGKRNLLQALLIHLKNSKCIRKVFGR